MGCLFSRSSNPPTELKEESEAPKQYSWDKRPKLDPAIYTIDNVKGETVGRLPGSLNGTMFIIKDCEDCNIYIFDHSATVTIDDCTNCKIFLAPVKGSVFIRDCKECTLVMACQQFRTRDCRKITVFLSCVTQPIIEATTGIKFGCFLYSYPELEEQFRATDMSVYNNNWSTIHDFTPVPGENNYSLLSEDVKIEDVFPPPTTEELSVVKVSTDSDSSVVPYTLGSHRKPSNESCLIIFFYDGGSHDRARHFIQQLKKDHPEYVLVQTKEITMQPTDCQRVFGSDAYSLACQSGPVIGFEYNGDGCCPVCQQTVVTVSQGTTGVVFVSSNPNTAPQQIDAFYNFAEMQMSV